jgi:hypothetical protein
MQQLHVVLEPAPRIQNGRSGLSSVFSHELDTIVSTGLSRAVEGKCRRVHINWSGWLENIDWLPKQAHHFWISDIGAGRQ